MTVNGRIGRLPDDDRTAKALQSLDALIAGRKRPLLIDAYRERQADKAADKARLPQVIDALASDGNSDTPAE